MVSVVDEAPTVDAATYWRAFAEEADPDPVAALMAQRRRGAAYARPASALVQLEDVAAALLRGIAAMPERACLWQGHVFAPGDFLAAWAVENVVHQLDLCCAVAAPRRPLALVRATVEALIDRRLRREWDDERAALIGTGRMPVPDAAADLAGVLPALG